MSDARSLNQVVQIQVQPLTLDLLIQQCLKGEEQAYDSIYGQYAGTIYRLCYGLLHHKEDAEEVLQDTFEYAFRRLSHFDPNKAGLKTWLYQIAVSRCRNKRRRKRLNTLPLSLLTGGQSEDRQAISPVDHLLLDETQKVVWQALDQLSPKLRETAVLRYFEEFTYGQIGEILSIPAKTAESRMRLAHIELRKLLINENETTLLDESR